ncbi:hypothetical protein HGM15179_003558 [Zosterops borbonicus]|uniref:Uncharacterized protein n=1 Tax=Zosterops borbonicus TaxID=364589 RepID=A0A8K1GTR5_9PASS|nr:hypothetical protein HGM15179_003558 [Zosterops borbonicus]
MGNFNHPSIYKRDSTVGHRQSWRPLEYISFFIQVTEEQCSLDLLLTNKEGLTVDVRVKGSSDNEMAEFGVLKGDSASPMEMDTNVPKWTDYTFHMGSSGPGFITGIALV